MPTVNIYQNTGEFESKLRSLTDELKKLVAKELSGSDIQLGIDEITVRFINVTGDGMLAPVELEVNAAAFKERVEKQDEICLTVQKFLKDKLQIDVKVWLVLSELGHSWK